MTVRVKICGLTRAGDVSDAIDCGTDAVGFVFGYGASPRNLSFEKLQELVRAVPPYVNTVVVTPVSNPELARVIDKTRPTFLQLYTDSPASASVKKKLASFANLIETVHPMMMSNQDEGKPAIAKCESVSKACRGILLDSPSFKPGSMGQSAKMSAPGGSGIPHNWELSRQIRDALYPFPVILSGGLDDRNVQKAILEVKPFAVDVSSGVESSLGIKDTMRVKRFIENAKSV